MRLIKANNCFHEENRETIASGELSIKVVAFALNTFLSRRFSAGAGVAGVGQSLDGLLNQAGPGLAATLREAKSWICPMRLAIKRFHWLRHVLIHERTMEESDQRYLGKSVISNTAWTRDISFDRRTEAFNSSLGMVCSFAGAMRVLDANKTTCVLSPFIVLR